MKNKKIVAKFKDGSTKKGIAIDFYPDKSSLKLQRLNDKFETIEMEDLKAVFFVKNFQGNKNHKDKYQDSNLWVDKKIRVDFTDGESIIGHTMHYSLGHHGFFLIPADHGNNNEQIFVLTSATKRIVFL
jgi:hypothetical protein